MACLRGRITSLSIHFRSGSGKAPARTGGSRFAIDHWSSSKSFPRVNPCGFASKGLPESVTTALAFAIAVAAHRCRSLPTNPRPGWPSSPKAVCSARNPSWRLRSPQAPPKYGTRFTRSARAQSPAALRKVFATRGKVPTGTAAAGFPGMSGNQAGRRDADGG